VRNGDGWICVYALLYRFWILHFGFWIFLKGQYLAGDIVDIDERVYVHVLYEYDGYGYTESQSLLLAGKSWE